MMNGKCFGFIWEWKYFEFGLKENNFDLDE